MAYQAGAERLVRQLENTAELCAVEWSRLCCSPQCGVDVGLELRVRVGDGGAEQAAPSCVTYLWCTALATHSVPV